MWYILDGKTPVHEPDVMKASRWMAEVNRHVANTKLADGVIVSTVFLGLDHGWGRGKPVLFESMVFGGPLDQEQERYCTWNEAEAGHAEMVRRVTEAQLKPTQG